MSLINLLADHVGETYNTLAGSPKVTNTKKAFGSSLPVRYGNQLADRFQNSMATAIDPNLPYWQKTDATMDLAGLAMTGGIAGVPNATGTIVGSGPYKKLFLPPKGFDTRQLDDIMQNIKYAKSPTGQYGHLWDMGGFMPVSRMPLEKFLKEGPINHFQHFYNEGIPKGIIKMPGPRGEIQSVSYMGLEDAANDWLKLQSRMHPYFNVEQPFDPSKQLVTNGRVNLTADPYFVYNAAFEPNNLNYKPDGKSVYNPLYQKLIREYVENNRPLSQGPVTQAKIAHRQRVYDKAFSIPPRELIRALEQHNDAGVFPPWVPAGQMYLTRAEFPFAPKKEHPEHYNSYSTPTDFLNQFNDYVKLLNEHPQYLDSPETYVQKLKEGQQHFLGQDARTVNVYNAYATPHPLYDSNRIFPKDAVETIALTKPGVNPLVTPHSVLVKQKNIEHKMPLWEYVQYFLKHGVTPFALGGMMVNNSKENKQ